MGTPRHRKKRRRPLGRRLRDAYERSDLKKLAECQKLVNKYKRHLRS